MVINSHHAILIKTERKAVFMVLKKPWYDALNDPGYNQMKYLKNLMLTFPFFERVPDQSVITGQNGERYDRAMQHAAMTI